MTISNSIILGLVQGVTEFLPVSSTGHLIVVRDVLSLPLSHSLTFDVFLHLATVLAVVIYFHRDIWRLVKTFINLVLGRIVNDQDRVLFWAIIIGTIPAAILGFFFQSMIEGVFRTPTLVAVALLAGSILFWVAEKRALQNQSVDTKKGLAIGFWQALALIPGISRSGATISGGLLLGLTREAAARFSFLLAFPIILGAGLKKIIDFGGGEVINGFGWPLFVGALVAFVSGLATIHFLISYLRNHTLNLFIAYRVILAALILLLL